MRIRSEEIASVIAREIENYEDKLVAEEVGTVMEVGDGIARIYGLQGAMAGEMLEFEKKYEGYYKDEIGIGEFATYVARKAREKNVDVEN